MADLLNVAVTLAFFALAAGLVKVCNGFIDQEPLEGELVDEAAVDEAVVDAAVGGGAEP